MKPTNVGIAGAAAVVLAIASVSLLLMTRLGAVGQGTSGQPVTIAASGLPAGGCPLSTDNLPVAESTKMVARFVTFDVALASDPNFPFKGGSGVATGARTPGSVRIANYFWVVAAAGNFHIYLARPPQSGPDSESFSFLVF